MGIHVDSSLKDDAFTIEDLKRMAEKLDVEIRIVPKGKPSAADVVRGRVE